MMGENNEKTTLEFICPKEALKVNRFNDHGDEVDSVWIKRETRVLELVIAEKERSI